MSRFSFGPNPGELVRLLVLIFFPAIFLAMATSYFQERDVREWDAPQSMSGTTRPIKHEGPREFSHRVYGRGFFDGGPKVHGDKIIDFSRYQEKGPPFRPSRFLKGIPLNDQGSRRRSHQSSRASSGLTTWLAGRQGAVSLQAMLVVLFFALVLVMFSHAGGFLPTAASGFTLIELVMVILLLSVLAAVAIPNFNDFRSDARDSATKGALGGMRSAIAIARSAIALKEDVGVPLYPTALELQANVFAGSHPILNTWSTVNKRIMDAATGIPVNPWAMSSLTVTAQSSVWDCTALAKNLIRSAAEAQIGWCYNATSGDFWPNSDRNGQVSPNTENKF